MNRNPPAPAIVLVEPHEEGNIGAVARAMANMGLSELVLVAPEVSIGAVAHAFAVGAGHILEQARVEDTFDEALAPYHRVIGTTSGRGRAVSVPVIAPRELPPALLQEDPETSVAVVFGSEPSGLDNAQIARCSLLVGVPCAPAQPTLNLGQAVLIVAYEIFLARPRDRERVVDLPKPASSEELDGLFSQIVPLLGSIGFARDDTFESVLRDLRQLAARAGPTPREVSILRGICRRAQRTTERH